MKYKVLTMNSFYKDIAFPTRDIFGVYPSSDYSPIPGLNHKVFMMIFNLDHRLFSYMDHMDEESYVKDCIESLNKVPKSKRDKTPIFGQLTYFKHKTIVHKSGNKYIQVFALTNENKNKVLFRIGDQIDTVPSVKQRRAEQRELEMAEGGDAYVNKVEKILDAAPKKRGRPAKSPEQKALEAKKKEDTTPKKRGRPAKNKKRK